MKLAVLSDLHLGPPPSNRCTASPEALLRLLDELEATTDRLIVAGDLFDLSRPRRPGAWRAHLAQIRDAYPELHDRLAAHDWIYGNHDLQLARLGVPPRRVIEADGLRILVQHGHQFDGGIKRLAGLPEAANFVAGWLHRAHLRPVARLLGDVPVGVDRLLAADERSLDRALMGARGLLEQGWDLVVMGHAHELRLVPHAGGLFVNTGALCEGHLDHVVLDTERRTVTATRDGRIHARARRGAADDWVIDRT